MTLENAQVDIPQAPEPALENRRGRQPVALPAEYEAIVTAYAERLARSPLRGATPRTYLSAVRVYLAWLAEGDHDGHPLDDPAARDWAVRDYRTHLVTVLKRSPATVNKVAAGLDDFYTWRGLGPANVKRQEIPAAAPRALSPRAMTRYLRAVEACPSARDRLIGLLPFYAGLRVSEVAGLDLDDITMSARKGEIRVIGKGEKTRVVPLHAKLREALTAWLAERPAGDGALFTTRVGTRPTAEAVNDVIAAITMTAGLDEKITAHTLRHCFGTNLVRDGVDLPTVATLMGHARLETTRRYSAPSADDLERAVGRLPVDA
jgi:site-specific recombinase XerD